MKAILEHRISHTKLAWDRFERGMRIIVQLLFRSAGNSYPIRTFAADDSDLSNKVATLDQSGHLEIWDRRNGSKDCQGSFTLLINGPAAGEFTLFDRTKAYFVDQGKLVELTNFPEPDGITAAQWDSGRSRLALGYHSGKLKILRYDPASSGLKPIVEIPAHTAVVNSISWQGDKLATGSSDGTAKVWDLHLTSSFTQLIADLNRLSQFQINGNIDLSTIPGFDREQFFQLWQSRLRELDDREAKAKP